MKRVLIVEDDPDIGSLLEIFLTEEGFDVKLATNGKVAIDGLLAGSFQPQLILLDLMMPVMDGAQFCLERSKHEKLSEIPVIIMSADANLKVRESELHAKAFLKKPLDIDTLVETVKRVAG